MVLPLAVTPAPQEPEKSESVRLLILGDSMSAFSERDEAAFYPGGDVTEESAMWWAILGDRLPWDMEETAVKALPNVRYSNNPTVFLAMDSLMPDPNTVLLALGLDEPADADAAIAAGLQDALRVYAATWPEARIILVIPPVATAAEAWDSAAEAARAQGAQVIDLRESLVSKYPNLYTLDGRHPNAAGMTAIANYIVNQFR